MVLLLTGHESYLSFSELRLIRKAGVDLGALQGPSANPRVGRPFDPRIHGAVAAISRPDIPANTVIEEVRPGFMKDGKPLRPASVVVAC
jgi:hypothetical protein